MVEQAPGDSLPHADLLQFLAQRGELSQAQAERLVAEVLAYFDEPVADYVRRRHLALHRQGLRNEHIYALLLDEVNARPFRAAPLTVRKIRRIIYG